MKRFLGGVVVVVLLALMFSPPAWAPAPRSAIFRVANVLAQLDESSRPSYPQEGFLDRNGLTTSVIRVLDLMITSPTDSLAWCPPMQDIADNDGRYFDARINPNPARDAFTRDWVKAMRRAGCLAAP